MKINHCLSSFHLQNYVPDKDVLIQQLTQQLHSLRQSQLHYHDLNNKAASLDHQLTALRRDKDSIQVETTIKTDLIKQNLSSLQHQASAYRASMRQLILDREDIDADRKSISNTLLLRNNELERLRGFVQNLRISHHEMETEQNQLKKKLSEAKRGRNQALDILTEKERLHQDQNIMHQENDKRTEIIELDLASIRQQSAEVEEHAHAVSSHLDGLIQSINYDTEISRELSDQLKQCRKNLSDLTSQIDHTKYQSKHFQRQLGTDLAFKTELVGCIMAIQKKSINYDREIEIHSRMLDESCRENACLNQDNQRLISSWKALQNHAQNLGRANALLMGQLEALGFEDTEMGRLLDRREELRDRLDMLGAKCP